MIPSHDNFQDEILLDHIRNPAHRGRLENPTHSASAHNPLCGDVVHLDLQITNNTITAITQTGQGCALSQATASILCEHLKGQSVDEAKQMTEEGITSLLGIPLSPTRQLCASLAFQALQRCLKK